MKRREFIAFLGGATLASPFVARAQQAITPVVGFLHSSAPNYFAQMAPAFSEGLKEAGYVERQNITIEYRWAEGDYNRLPGLAKDLVDRHVAVILAAGGTDPAKAAKIATSEIPIVFVSAADPVQTGLVSSLSRPTGNVTGVSLLASQLNAKKLDLLSKLVSREVIFGALINPNYPQARNEFGGFPDSCQSSGTEGGSVFCEHRCRNRCRLSIPPGYSANWRSRHRHGPVLWLAAGPDSGARPALRGAGNLLPKRVCRCWRPTQLWPELP